MKEMLTFLLSLTLCLTSFAQDLQSLFQQGRAQYDSAQYDKALISFREFEKIRDNYPPVNAYLAAVYGRLNRKEDALRYLNKTAIINADTALLSRPDFDVIRDSEEFKKITDFYLHLLKPVHLSELAFTIDDAEIHPETLAYDQESSRFFIGSIRLRQILIYERGRSYMFKKEAEDSLLAVTGLDVDKEGNVLWVSSAVMPQMKNKDGQATGSRVHIYDLETGSLIRSHRLQDEGVLLGDLIVGSDGRAYCTSSNRTEIYMANLDSIWLSHSFPEMRNIQGITFDKSGNLYFSDYIRGIFKIVDGKAVRVEHGKNISTKGIDGLYYRKGNFIGIQNGVFPMRVAQYVYDSEKNRITDVIYLDKNLDEMREPVQGTWVGDWFYFIANSPWPYYTEDNELNPETTPSPMIWRVNLH
ncbi:hypothetical protein [Fulvivirga sedimenti]|uniref:Tetratricopeptide repeat protein n=1 Tax=Fulvivirga sedimenti TaxID=2879465 RepID=A0A9X1HM85_9BACT|nr:hypothetical protein [Fulvivirga sedimenti]MCA6073976.1 hypothetical protein [Fulvivirga sedimenti]